MDLHKIRATIDSIDAEIIRLLSKRIEFAIRTRRFKEDVADTTREKEVLERIRAKSKWLITPQFSEELFSLILTESKRLQSFGMQLVGFHGEHGSPSEYALSQHNKEWIPIPCANTAEIFEGVKSGALDFGIVPIENSTEGSITPVIDALVSSDLSISAELVAPVHYCLLALPESDYRDIKVVYSTVEALSACKNFLDRHRFEGRPYYDTAGAARMLTKEKPPAASVISHELCAEVYGLQILKKDVEEHAHTKIRYIVLSREQNLQGVKCTISFTAKHEAGSLLKILEVFAVNGINLTRIESCTNPDDSAHAMFIVDFEGSGEATKVKESLKEIEKHTLSMKFFGSYSSFLIADSK